jgi:hypothetical protein
LLDAGRRPVHDGRVTHNEVVGGSAEASGSGWVLIIAVAVAAALISLLANHSSSTAAGPAPAPNPAPALLPSATPSAVPSSAPSFSDAPAISLNATQAVLQQSAGFIQVRDICPPSTNRKTTLDISAVLENDTAVPEHIVFLSPALPLSGLKDKGVVIRSGTCDHPIGKGVPASGQLLPPDGVTLVTLHLGLPTECPHPYPVSLDVTLSISGNVRSELVRLFNDLGGVAFDSCPSATTS